MHSNLITQTLETLSIKQAIALGNDLVYLPNFKQSFSELFKAKVYTDKEISYCNQFEDSLLRYASTWAAKAL